MKRPPVSARRVILAWVLALVAVVIIASGDDPEGLAVGQQHLEQALELDRQDRAQREVQQALQEGTRK